MATAGINHFYQYSFVSAIAGASGRSLLSLATAKQGESYPHFFEGRLLQPRSSALLLSALAKISTSRFYTPPNMLQKLIGARDPVITSGGGMLRFEAFSLCCSAYARVDLKPGAYEGDLLESGTTNVDFNSPLLSALSNVRDEDYLSISVGPNQLALRRGAEEFIERKVDLPLRWLRGFVEVQAYQSKMQPVFSVSRVEAIRFLRSLPSNAHYRSSFWIVPSGKGLRLSHSESSGCPRIAGLDRLRTLVAFAPIADSLKVYVHPSGDSSEFVMHCGALAFSLTISAEASRGFSGEGQVLSDLVERISETNLAAVRAQLRWQSLLSLSEIANLATLSLDDTQKAMALLGSRGLVGFDVDSGNYFHREMPFDTALVEEMHPRLVSARELIAANAVEILNRTGERIEANVASDAVVYRVRTPENHCTCPWHSKYQGSRGLCKHILAVQLIEGLSE